MMKLFCVMSAMVSFAFAGRNEKETSTKQTLSVEGSSADALLAPEVAAVNFHVNKDGGNWYVTMKVKGMSADGVEKVVAGPDDAINSLLESVNKELDPKYTKLTVSKGAQEGEAEFNLSAEGNNGKFVTILEGGKKEMKNKAEMKKGLLAGLAAIEGEGPSAEESGSEAGAEVVAAKKESGDEVSDDAPNDGQPDSGDGPAPAAATKGGKKGGKSSSVRKGISAIIVVGGLTQLLM
eukprot:TRINITY_DN3050_c0_g1_i1.p1 TRINITY_DN3050_c0_g1~~TRINITY_DN3050_c0_g1_i1.p1  ORF type:complete len:236 (+),score=64.24 TRINITY_DN3050_c0_g1_i1:66-773(+)